MAVVNLIEGENMIYFSVSLCDINFPFLLISFQTEESNVQNEKYLFLTFVNGLFVVV